MKHIAAALLLALGGKDINEKNINEVLSSVGVKPVPSIVKQIVDNCKGKKLDQLIAEGLPKMSGSVGGAVVVNQTPVAAAATTTTKKEEPKKGGDAKGGKKEEKKPEPKVEEEEDMGMGLGDLF